MCPRSGSWEAASWARPSLHPPEAWPGPRPAGGSRARAGEPPCSLAVLRATGVGVGVVGGSDHASEARGAGLRVSEGHSQRWLRLMELEARRGWGSKHPSRSGGMGDTLLTAGVGALLAGTCRPADKGSQEECPCHKQAHCPSCLIMLRPQTRGDASPCSGHAACQLGEEPPTAAAAECHLLPVPGHLPSNHYLAGRGASSRQ